MTKISSRRFRHLLQVVCFKKLKSRLTRNITFDLEPFREREIQEIKMQSKSQSQLYT